MSRTAELVYLFLGNQIGSIKWKLTTRSTAFHHYIYQQHPVLILIVPEVEVEQETLFTALNANLTVTFSFISIMDTVTEK
jgi:hypothetical protein